MVDDCSPDGTGTLADELAAADAHIHVLHHAGKKGLGAAYIAGFRWALDEGFGAVVEMDADGSHQPEQLRFSAGCPRPQRPGDRITLGSWQPRDQLAEVAPTALEKRKFVRAPHAGRRAP
jgi:glycosyltransferase involved in cell wall biosynthesis